MPRSAPDWYPLRRQVYSTVSTDMAEVAARLGSPVVHDRRGTVIYIEDFASGLSHWILSVPTGGAAHLSLFRARHGLLSLRLFSPTGAFAATEAFRRFPPPPLAGRVGVESSFDVYHGVGLVQLFLSYRDGQRAAAYGVRFSAASAEVTYFDATGSWATLVPPFTLPVDLDRFYTWKLVVDPARYQYVRLLIDDRIYDMSGIAAYTQPDTSFTSLRVGVGALGTASGSITAYIDDIIVTVDEP